MQHLIAYQWVYQMAALVLLALFAIRQSTHHRYPPVIGRYIYRDTSVTLVGHHPKTYGHEIKDTPTREHVVDKQLTKLRLQGVDVLDLVQEHGAQPA